MCYGVAGPSDRGRRKGTTGAPPAVRRGHPLELIGSIFERTPMNISAVLLKIKDTTAIT